MAVARARLAGQSRSVPQLGAHCMGTGTAGCAVGSRVGQRSWGMVSGFCGSLQQDFCAVSGTTPVTATAQTAAHL